MISLCHKLQSGTVNTLQLGHARSRRMYLDWKWSFCCVSTGTALAAACKSLPILCTFFLVPFRRRHGYESQSQPNGCAILSLHLMHQACTTARFTARSLPGPHLHEMLLLLPPVRLFIARVFLMNKWGPCSGPCGWSLIRRSPFRPDTCVVSPFDSDFSFTHTSCLSTQLSFPLIPFSVAEHVSSPR